MMSNYLRNALLNHVFRGVSYSMPSNLYVALTIAPTSQTDTGSTISEPSTGGYARAALNPGTGNWTSPVAGVLFNNSSAVFPQCTGTWGIINGGAICDAASGGNVLFYGPVIPPWVITSSSPPFTLKPGQIREMING